MTTEPKTDKERIAELEGQVQWLLRKVQWLYSQRMIFGPRSRK